MRKSNSGWFRGSIRGNINQSMTGGMSFCTSKQVREQVMQGKVTVMLLLLYKSSVCTKSGLNQRNVGEGVPPTIYSNPKGNDFIYL